MLRSSLALLLAACAGGGPASEKDPGEILSDDSDRDGFSGEDDCNEGDPATHQIGRAHV
jgi:hypothetical protein